MTSTTQDHASIPLIYLSSQHQPKFVLNPKAIKLIQSYNSNNQMTFISICGDYRSGKSFLMNSLFFSKQGFKVSPTIEPCTKGINLWSKPMSYNGKNIWILDTEGFGAIDRDDSYDVKIFLLTTLISDIVMYNSFGALDQNTINKFAAICHKAESLDHGLKKIKMFWILRDFSLSIQNKEGRILTANEYLQSALDDCLSSSNDRQAIKRVFGERHCIPLVRPVIDQKILSQLSEIKFQQLRGQFVQQVYKLRKKLLSCIESKVIEGVKIDGQNLGMFVNKYLEILNTNQMDTDISSTWEKIVEYEKEKSQAKVRGKIREILGKELERIPFTAQGLVKIIQQNDKIIQQQLNQYSRHFTNKQLVKSTQQSLKQYITDTRSQLLTKNMQYLRNQQKKAVKAIFESVQKQVGKESKMEDNQLIQKYLQKLFKTKDQYTAKFGKYLSAGEKDKKTGKQQLQLLLNSKQQLSFSRQQLLRINQQITQCSQLVYYQHFFHEQKLMFPKIVGQLSEQLASTIGKMNQLRKTIKSKDIDVKVLIQQKQKLAEDITQLNKEINKLHSNKLQLAKQLDLKQHQIAAISTKSETDYLQIKSQYQQNIQQLKETILSLQKNFLSIKKQNELQTLQFQDKITHLNQKNQLIQQKLQQNKLLHQTTLIQLKEQHEQKLRKQQDKFTDLQNNLNLQRKKFLQLNKTKKQQQSQLLEDLAEKNEKLLSLRREITNIEHIYKEQLDSLLNQQKANLQKEFLLQFQQKEHLLNVLEQKLQHCMIRIQQLQQTQKKYETLLMQHRLLTQQHLNVVDKYKEIHNKLKKSTQAEQQKQTVFEEIKENYQSQLKSKDEMLRKFKLQIKNTQQQKNKTIQQLQIKHINQINTVKSTQAALYQQKLRQRLAELQTTYKSQKSQLLQQLKDSFSEIQGLKSIRQRQESEMRYFTQIVVGLLKEYKVAQKEIRAVMKKYKKIEKDTQLTNNNNSNISNNKQNKNDNNNKQGSKILPSQLDKIDENMSMMEESSMMTQSMAMRDQSRDDSQSMLQNKSGYITRESVQELQSHFLLILQSNRALTEQLEDLKHSFKQTIQQLESCQLHINKLNTKISTQDQQLTGLSSTINQLQQTKKQLHQKSIKLQSLQKSSELLKKQVQLRDEIYLKRESSIKENLQLYKQTIANLTQQNQHLTQKSTKLQIELNRFAQWQADLTVYNQNRTKSNVGSFDFMTQNMDYNQTDQMFSFGDKISKLQKENRKLKKELHEQKELTLNNTLKPPAANSLTNILIDTNSGQMQSLKKQNQTYKKRVEQLRQRQLKLLQEIKTVKANEKQSAQTKVNLVRDEFQAYRRKSKEEIVQLEGRVDQLMEEKYKLKQEMLVMKQDRSAYMVLGGGKGVGNNSGSGENISISNNNHNNSDSIQQKTTATSTIISRPYTQSQQNQSMIQPYLKTIQSLKQQNGKLQLQVNTLNAQLVKLKDESDKKLASLQVFYQDQIRQLQQQKSRIDLQNEKNKTKYQHLLKVNNQLIIEVDNFKAKANNQLTLKEKYRNKISALFTDD